MSAADAIAHLDEAMRLLTVEACRGNDLDHMEKVDDLTIAVELDRVDCAIGPRGESMFGKLADDIIAAFVEIKAARQALAGEGKADV